MSEMHVNCRARGILGTVELSSAMFQKGVRAANAVAVVEESGELMLKITNFTKNEATLIEKQRVATAVPLRRVLSSSSKNNPEVSGLNHGSQGKS
jgi:dUTPase